MTTTSTSTRRGLRKLTARLGAEVTGVSPSLELDPDTVTAIRAALNEHKALVFRGISVDDDGQQRFARYFGPLTSAHPTVPAVQRSATGSLISRAIFKSLSPCQISKRSAS